MSVCPNKACGLQKDYAVVVRQINSVVSSYMQMKETIMQFMILLLLTFSTYQILAGDTTLIINNKTRYSTLANKYYHSVYYDTLLKVYNKKNGEFLNPGDTAIIPDLDSLLFQCRFSTFFKNEIDLIYKASSYQTTMYTYESDVKRIGIDSISKNAKKGAAIIQKAIRGIKMKCDSLNFAYPKSVISQLNSAAVEMSSYPQYLNSSGIYASKNIYVQNLHLNLWKMYAALWCLNGFK